MAEVALRGLTKRFGREAAVEGVDLVVPDGAFVVLLGPTGAGKTTTLRLVAGLEAPDGGTVSIGGRDVGGLAPARRDVTMVFQQYSLYPHLSVRDNLAFPLRSPILRTPADRIERRVREVAEVLSIAHKLDSRATTLSGGEMQRVSIGRALVREPAVHLMDEPLSSLDAKLRSNLRVELRRIQGEMGATLLYVTHDQIEAMTMATHVGVLDRGRLVQFGAPPRDLREPGEPRGRGPPRAASHQRPAGGRLSRRAAARGHDRAAPRAHPPRRGAGGHGGAGGAAGRPDAAAPRARPPPPGDAGPPPYPAPARRDDPGAAPPAAVVRRRGPAPPARLREALMTQAPTQFINARDAVVTEAIDGAIRTLPGLARLDGYPHIRVVVREDADPARVALVSGGGSGHEPAHAAFVGRGMLTAAVCGDVFASPSVDAVLAGILAVTGPAGCLLIVKNYTGDRLNFGLAAERARALGLAVEMVVVADDVALPDLPQPRGVAGTLFVHKVAGALAEQGRPLAEVAQAAREVAAAARSIGLSLDTGTVPGSPKEARIAPGEAELGLGIHGEPGVERVPFEGAAHVVARMVERLAPTLEDGPQVALVNNLGGTTALEMSILADALLSGPLGPRIERVIGPAPLMTSLDMRGASVSLLPLRGWGEALAAPVGPPAWPGCRASRAPVVLPMPEGLAPPEPTPSPNAAVEALLARGCDALIEAEAELNALDAKSGDGDTGSTLAGAARALRRRLPALPLAEPAPLLRALGQELGTTMGGSSGVLLAILFAAAGDAAASGAPVVGALRAGLDRVREVGGAEPGDRTMIDALLPALDALPRGLDAAARAAREGARATAGMGSAKAGRAAYASAGSLGGHADPGAEAVARLFEALARD